jgi:general secretion pathway protein G
MPLAVAGGLVLLWVCVTFIVNMPVFWGAPGTGARVAIARAAIGPRGPMAAALDAYKRDTGKYPDTDQGLRILVLIDDGSGDPGHKGPYLEGTLEDLEDPWGNAFEYRCPGAGNSEGYDLWSCGPDRKNDGGAKGSDDIKNWVDK